MSKSIPASKAKALADFYFSRYIRIRDTDKNGYGKCITSGRALYWKDGDCGHFQSRGHLNTRWNPMNAHLQSKKDNGPGGGQQYRHGLAIEKRYGKGTADKLELAAHKSVKLGSLDFLIIAQEFRRMAMEEFHKRNIEWQEAPGSGFNSKSITGENSILKK